MFAQDKFQQSLKAQKDDLVLLQAAIKDGTYGKNQIDTLMQIKDPEMIDTKANLKEQFSKLTMGRQPRPGPDSYNLPGSIQLKYKPVKHQFFGSTNARF